MELQRKGLSRKTNNVRENLVTKAGCLLSKFRNLNFIISILILPRPAAKTKLFSTILCFISILRSQKSHGLKLTKNFFQLVTQHAVLKFSLLRVSSRTANFLLLWWLVGTKHFPESKTRPRNQKHFPESKARTRIQKHFPESTKSTK